MFKKNKKKILVVGSVADFGGREIEVKNLILMLSAEYEVKLFSTVPITENSMAIEDLNCKWTSIHKELYKSNFLIRVFALMSKKWNKSNLPSYLLVSNKISSKIFNFYRKNLKILKKQIASVDLVLFCGVFTNGYLKEIINYCQELNKPIVLRTTGEIVGIPNEVKELLFKVTVILVHSNSNTIVLKNSNLNNFRVLDQTTSAENNLLKLKIIESKELVYGYIGRFSPEKGIVELLDMFKGLEKKLLVAGNGPLLDQVLTSCENNLFTEYVGEISSNKIVDFFNAIDVLIIPSFEESGPLVGIEAMAAGKIIISTKVGAMNDRLDSVSNQFWFDINDKNSLVSTLSKLESLDANSTVTIRKEIRERFKEKYSKDIISEQYLDVIKNCLK